MTPLQRIAMGLVIVVGTAAFPAHPHPSWQHYDALADPVGWLLVLSGLRALRRLHAEIDSTVWLALVATVISVPLWFPQLNHRLDASGAWFASMPQTFTCLLLAHRLGRLGALQEPRNDYVTKRFGLLVWGFALIAVLPVLTLGGGLVGLVNLTLLMSLLVNVAFIWFLFLLHRRPWLGGPGPREVHPAPRPDARKPPSNGERPS